MRLAPSHSSSPEEASWRLVALRRALVHLRCLLFVVSFIAALAWVSPAAAAAANRLEPVELSVGDTLFSIDAPQGMSGFVREVSDVISGSWLSVLDALGAPSAPQIHVHIERDLQDWFTRNDLPWRPPEWAAGLAISRRRVILIAPGNPGWADTTVHELAHLAVALAAADKSVPKWFNEGMAVGIAEQWDLDRSTLMMQAGVFGNFLERADLDKSWPQLASQASLAYAQSASLVRFGERSYGGNVWRDILELMRQDESLEWSSAFIRVTGESETMFWESWLDSAKTRWSFVPLVTGAGLGWVLIMLLAIFVWRWRQRQSRERLAEMRRSEAYEPRDPDDEIFA